MDRLEPAYAAGPVSTMDLISKDITQEIFLFSIAAVCNIFVANLIGTIRGSDSSKWLKAITILCLDIALCLTVPLIAIAEVLLRLALAIVSLPLSYCCCLIDDVIPPVLFFTTLYSVVQIPNTFVTCYQSFTKNDRILAKKNGQKFICA